MAENEGPLFPRHGHLGRQSAPRTPRSLVPTVPTEPDGDAEDDEAESSAKRQVCS